MKLTTEQIKTLAKYYEDRKKEVNEYKELKKRGAKTK